MDLSVYKLEILLLKYIPIILAILYFIGSIIPGCKILWICLGFFGYTSILSWIFMLVSSFAFKFCIWHRMPLYYILINNLFTIIYRCVSFSNPIYVILSILLFGIFTILTAYFKNKQNVKNNKKYSTTNN